MKNLSNRKKCTLTFWQTISPTIWISVPVAATSSHKITNVISVILPGDSGEVSYHFPILEMPLILKTQEIPYEAPDSNNQFRPGPEKPFLATPAAIETHRHETIMRCLALLQETAERYNGLDYLQVFKNSEPGEPDLWFIEDGPGGAITALLPDDY